MRLWHVDLIPQLPRQQLLGQHRECAALRGRGWGKPHSTVNYVFERPYSWLFNYHVEIMREMDKRGYRVTDHWWCISYRGKALGDDLSDFVSVCAHETPVRYPEHNAAYLAECLSNLRGKGVEI